MRQAAGQELATENRQGLNPRLGGFQQWYGRDLPSQTVLANKLRLPSANVQNGDAARMPAPGQRKLGMGRSPLLPSFLDFLKAYLLHQPGSFEADIFINPFPLWENI